MFGSRTRVKILCELLVNPGRTYHLRELSRRLKVSYSVLYREVKNLAGLGIVRCEERGRLTLVSANRRLPYFGELRSLLIKTVALGDV